MADNFKYTTGLWSAGAFQSSGMPFVIVIDPSSGAVAGKKVTFPYVTNWVHIRNQATTPVTVGFSSNGVQGGANNFQLQARGSSNDNPLSVTPTMELKLTEMWFSGSSDIVYVVAGLTNIPTARINNSGVSPSGSNWSGSYDGVG